MNPAIRVENFGKLTQKFFEKWKSLFMGELQRIPILPE